MIKFGWSLRGHCPLKRYWHFSKCCNCACSTHSSNIAPILKIWIMLHISNRICKIIVQITITSDLHITILWEVVLYYCRLQSTCHKIFYAVQVVMGVGKIHGVYEKGRRDILQVCKEHPGAQQRQHLGFPPHSPASFSYH